MKGRYSYLVFGGVALIGLSACSPDDQADMDPALETPIETPATQPTETPTVQPTMPSASAAALTVAEGPEYGTYITDAQGNALYLLEADTETQSNCYDECAQTWSPFLAAEGSASAQAPQLEQSLIGTIQRTDGSTQVTYGGHPLYHYSADQEAGQPTGQDVTDQWGEWYLVTPDGEAVDEM